MIYCNGGKLWTMDALLYIVMVVSCGTIVDKEV